MKKEKNEEKYFNTKRNFGTFRQLKKKSLNFFMQNTHLYEKIYYQKKNQPPHKLNGPSLFRLEEGPLGLNLKWLKNKKKFQGFPNKYSTRLFCYITCTFKHTSLRLFRFTISQCVPFLIKIRKIHRKYAKRGQIMKFKI